MNAPMTDTTRTAIPAYEVDGGVFAFMSPCEPRRVIVFLEEVDRATVAGGQLVLERKPSAPVLLPASMNFSQTVLTGITGITRSIREDKAFAHGTDLFGRDVYYRIGQAKPPLNFKPIVRFVRKLMRANPKG